MICSEDKKYVDMIRTYSYPLVPVPVSEEVLESFRSRVPRLNGSFLQYPVILFDIYGTLFQSGSGDIGVFEQYREGRCALFPRGELFLLQERFASAVRDRHKKQGKTVEVPEVQVEEIWAELQNLDLEAAREFALRFELSVNPVYPMPGAKELFGLLQKRGIILGLVSNAQFFTPCYFEAFFSVSLEEMGFREDLCVFSFQAGEAKPSLQLFRFAAEVLLKYGFKAENCLYIGNDLLNDVWAPVQMGFKTALFAGDARSLRLHPEDPRCKDLFPDYLLEGFEELKDYVCD
ncbi:MAG TPA: HAD family hydrolase [Spirochaetales bacterium]|nr:HAD family hydrolase [Spirochaetales bacterium]